MLLTSVTDAAFFILLRICFRFLPIGVYILVHKWVSATVAWWVLRLLMEEQPPV